MTTTGDPDACGRLPCRPHARPPVITFLAPLGPTDPEALRRRLNRTAPGVEVQLVPYSEDPAARNARSRGIPVDPDPSRGLSEQQWAALERTTVAVALDLPAGMLERARALEWVQVIGAGTEHLDTGGLARKGVILTNGAGLAAAPIAEFVIGRLLQVWKGFRVLDAQQSERRWQPLHARRVAGLTLGVVGLGAIGRATAKRARAFDMRVLANRRSSAPGDEDPDVDRLFTADELDAMLGSCDAVVISAPATPDTRGLFDRGRIAAMKPGSILCNVSRGSLLDEEAVVDALASGRLSAAVLDVTAEEPTPADSPLWSAPNCYLSPHTAVSMDGYQDALVELIERNLGHYVRGEPLENRVEIR